jgi:diacylglycerol kinase (ATP)
MKVTLAFNPVSGRGHANRTAEGLSHAIELAGHVTQLVASKPGPGDWVAPSLRNADALVVVGGDGTVRSIAPFAAKAKVPLLHVPMGTENLLARAFGMRRDGASVVNAIEQGSRVAIDLAIANNEPMVLMVSGGFDAAVVADVSQHRGHAISKWSYMRAVGRCLKAFRTPSVCITVDDQVAVDGVQGWAVVANAPDYGARLDPAPHAKIDDGLLEVVFLPCRTRLGFVAWVVLARMGMHLKRRYAVSLAGRSVQIAYDHATPIQIDGDMPSGQANMKTLCVSVSPDQLTIIVPPTAKAIRALHQSLAGVST